MVHYNGQQRTSTSQQSQFSFEISLHVQKLLTDFRFLLFYLQAETHSKGEIPAKKQIKTPWQES